MAYKSLYDTLKNQITFYSYLVKHGKISKEPGLCLKTKYALIGSWEMAGLLEVRKSGRELIISPTKKGSLYYSVFNAILPYLDFFT